MFNAVQKSRDLSVMKTSGYSDYSARITARTPSRHDSRKEPVSQSKEQDHRIASLRISGWDLPGGCEKSQHEGQNVACRDLRIETW